MTKNTMHTILLPELYDKTKGVHLILCINIYVPTQVVANTKIHGSIQLCTTAIMLSIAYSHIIYRLIRTSSYTTDQFRLLILDLFDRHSQALFKGLSSSTILTVARVHFKVSSPQTLTLFDKILSIDRLSIDSSTDSLHIVPL